MAILDLSELYNNKGEEFLKALLNKKVTIYEKLAGSDFSFEVKNKKIYFYKGNTESLITKVDRALMKYYENAISYIESIQDLILSKIEENLVFGFEYFPDTVPNYIKYDTVPKNNLILSYIKKGKNLITNKDILIKYAKILNVSEPPILFQGEFSEEQKTKILEYLKLSPKEILQKYKVNSFTAFLISIANEKLKKTTLNDSIDKLIPGVIFQFDGDEGKIYAKIVDPMFNEIIKKNNSNEINDYIPIVLIYMIEFMQSYKEYIKTFKYKEIDEDEKYLELMSNLFNIFIKKNISKLKGVNLSTSALLKSLKFDINFYFIKNKTTQKFLTINDVNKDIFKLFVGSFRKKKKQITGFLNNTEIVRFFNEIVDLIKNSIQNNNEKSVIETFSEFLNLNIVNEDYNNNNLINENFESDNIIFWQKYMQKTEKQSNLEKNKKELNIIIGKFQPFNINHLENIKKIVETTKKKVIIIQVFNGKINDINPISFDVSIKIMNEISNEYSDYIAGYEVIESLDLIPELQKLIDKFKINIILANKNYIDFLKVFLKYINYNLSLRQIEKLEVVGISKIIQNAIKTNDLLTYRKYVPEKMYKYFEYLRSNLWMKV
jgi:hypothetical protein